MAGSKKACLFAHIETTLYADWTASLKNTTPCLQWTLRRRVRTVLFANVRLQNRSLRYCREFPVQIFPTLRPFGTSAAQTFGTESLCMFNAQTHDGSMVLLYMVWHGSHQYTPLYVSIHTSTMDPSWEMGSHDFDVMLMGRLGRISVASEAQGICDWSDWILLQ